MAFIDGSALTVALPAMRAEFGGGYGVLQWVLNGYILALAALTMPGGALADAYGRARILMFGVAMFGVASALCALAPSGSALVAARVLQGAAAALVTPASLAYIGELFPEGERARAIGAWAGASALTTAGGPLLGGALVEIASWRAVFWINAPIAIATIFLLWQAGSVGARATRPFDTVGALALAIALALGAYALSGVAPSEAGISVGQNDAGALRHVLSASVAAVVFILFLLCEARASAPLAPPGLFRSRPFAALNLATFGLYTALSIVFFVLPFDLVDARGFSATQTGLAFLPFTLAVGLLSRTVGETAGRVGEARLIVLGAGVAAGGFALLSVLRDASAALGVGVPMALAGVGFSLIVTPLTAGVMASVAPDEQGLASGVNNTISRAAQMLGVALAAALTASGAGGYWVAAGLALASAAVASASR